MFTLRWADEQVGTPWGPRLRIGFFPPDCSRDEILPVMSKIWGKMVASGSDMQKRKSAVQELYAEIMTLAPRDRGCGLVVCVLRARGPL